jgi:hypothetical protein
VGLGGKMVSESNKIDGDIGKVSGLGYLERLRERELENLDIVTVIIIEELEDIEYLLLKDE